MTAFGDTAFSPTEPAFTVAEAARVSGNTELDIRNWMRRDVISVGAKNRLGRIMFTALDIVQLKVIGDMNKLLGTDPSASLPIAKHVMEHCAAWLRRDNKHLHRTEDGFKRETRLVLHLGDDGRTQIMTPFESDTLTLPVTDRGQGSEWTRRPIVVLPVEQFFGDILEELFQILEGEDVDGT